MFLADPQGWKKPPAHPQAEELRAGDARRSSCTRPYVVNVASPNNRIRIPSRKLVAQHAEAAADGRRDRAGGARRARHREARTRRTASTTGASSSQRQADEGGFAVPILIENTAGGDNAMARRFDALARLWDAVGEFDVGFCLDTCHAFAAGEELVDVVDRVKAITGRIDLVHLNNSRDEFGSGARPARQHRRRARSTPDALVAVCAAAGAPVVVETPAEGQAADIAFLRERLGS